MRDMVKLGLILLLITSVSGLVLGVTNSLTEGIILERAMEGDIASMQALVPDADGFETADLSGIDVPSIVNEVYLGTQNGSVVGYTVKLSPNGYGGSIEMMVGISSTGEISGVEILSQSETPGLGSKITEADFLGQYTGLSTDGSVAVDAISGATVSSDAVNSGTQAAANLYEETLKNL